MSQACSAAGVGICVNEDQGTFQVLLSLFQEDAPPEECDAFMQLDPQTAMNIAAKLISAATEAGTLQQSVNDSPDPDQAMSEWITRFKAGLN